jgi:hypothetical protein
MSISTDAFVGIAVIIVVVAPAAVIVVPFTIIFGIIFVTFAGNVIAVTVITF